MKKLLSAFFLLIFVSNISIAQHKSDASDYNIAVGMKFYPGAVTSKFRLFNDNKLEALAYFWKGMRITTLYEHCFNIEGLSGLQWYIGPGAHVMMYNDGAYSGQSYFGVDAVLGLDYRIKNTPLNLSLDWQPSIDFGGNTGFNGGFGGLGVRYVLN